MSSKLTPKRRFLAPEVVQTSSMDCGPAALKCFMEGFGICASYGRLREACQTDVDGTSIDTIENIACQLGLNAEQIMVPVDYLLLREADVFPSLVVMLQPNGVTHFVVAWRRHGRHLQVMDPGRGRYWPTCERFINDIYLHKQALPAQTWRQWASSDTCLGILEHRLRQIGLSSSATQELVREALTDRGWRSLASLEAAARMMSTIIDSGGLRKGIHAARVLESVVDKSRRENCEESEAIPESYWSVRPAPSAQGAEQVVFSGAVLMRVYGRKPHDACRDSIPADLAAALQEQPARPGRELLKALSADGFLTPLALGTALLLAVSGVLVEALLFRALFSIGQNFGLAGQRLTAMGLLLAFLVGLLLLEIPIVAGALRLGRRLEVRLRTAFLAKIPRLGDRYFQSRLQSDMAERSHSIQQVRLLPNLFTQLVRSALELVVTAAAIAWINPASAPIALVGAGLALALPMMVQPVLSERDLRVRTHSGALSRFYLDAFLGLVAIRAHGADRSLQREHESLLVEWARSGINLQRAAVTFEGAQFLLGFGLAAWLLLDLLARGGEPAGPLLLVYWALNLPVLGQEIATIACQYPAHRNSTLRILEPLGARHEDEKSSPGDKPATQGERGHRGLTLSFEDVTVRAGGHTILQTINMKVESGCHVAIVGESGAGKSSLVGLLLGWHRPADGRILVDGELFNGARLDQLRRETAWIEPGVQLWNRSLLANLRYGTEGHGACSMDAVINDAELRDVLKRLPDGLQTVLGESGGLLSGGEGQRVRLGRAVLQNGVRLVIMDEPFGGLERERRRDLLERARRLWSDATILCITHDVGETVGFDRVIVVENGRIAEDGFPAELADQPDSRYRTLLDAESAVRRDMWCGAGWRVMRLNDGQLTTAGEHEIENRPAVNRA